MALFSIITVCRNTEKTIKKTIESVLNQTFQDYEYIVVDGASKDSTFLIAQSYDNRFSNINIAYNRISENDLGIYNAMNKGIGLAKGQWLLFLNAGDSFCSNFVLEKFAEFVDENYDIIYGDAIHTFSNLYHYEKCLPLDKMTEKLPFCHQSAFVSAELMRFCLYNENYKIAADFDFFLKCYLLKKKFLYVSLPVALFELGGISSSGNILRNIEHIQVLKENDVISEEKYQKEYSNLADCSRKYKRNSKLKQILPKWLLTKMRKFKCRKTGFNKINPAINSYKDIDK